MYKVKIEKWKYAEFFPFSQSGKFVLMDFGEDVVLPHFERGKMRKGMDDMREYAPKELGLWKK